MSKVFNIVVKSGIDPTYKTFEIADVTNDNQNLQAMSWIIPTEDREAILNNDFIEFILEGKSLFFKKVGGYEGIVYYYTGTANMAVIDNNETTVAMSAVYRVTTGQFELYLMVN